MSRRLTLAVLTALLALWVVVALALVPWPARAEGIVCTPHDEALSRLADRYGETVRARGLASNGWLVELLTSERGETWTLLITSPSMRSCVIGVGEAWQPISPTPNGMPT